MFVKGVCATLASVHCPLTWAVGGVMVCSWLRNSATAVQFSTTMNTTILLNNPIIDQYNELKQQVLDNETLQRVLYTLATILGVIVGVTVWVTNKLRQWYTNGGKQQLLSVTQRVLLFVSTSTEKLYYRVCDVTLSELPTNTRKRA